MRRPPPSTWEEDMASTQVTDAPNNPHIYTAVREDDRGELTPSNRYTPRDQMPDYSHLDELEAQSIYIMREAFNKFKNMAMLWSIGKDSSVMLWLARKAAAPKQLPVREVKAA